MKYLITIGLLFAMSFSADAKRRSTTVENEAQIINWMVSCVEKGDGCPEGVFIAVGKVGPQKNVSFVDRRDTSHKELYILNWEGKIAPYYFKIIKSSAALGDTTGLEVCLDIGINGTSDKAKHLCSQERFDALVSIIKNYFLSPAISLAN